MKRFIKLLQPHLVRPMIQSAAFKIMLGLCAVLLWSRYVLKDSLLSAVGIGQGFFFMAVYFLLWTWFQYLAFDGIRPFRNLYSDRDSTPHTPNTPFRLKDLLGEKPDAFSELDEEEQIAVRLCADLIAAALFLVLYEVFTVL